MMIKHCNEIANWRHESIKSGEEKGGYVYLPQNYVNSKAVPEKQTK